MLPDVMPLSDLTPLIVITESILATPCVVPTNIEGSLSIVMNDMLALK
jgi:hypothetical protein